jgi:hypothetical protein
MLDINKGYANGGPRVTETGKENVEGFTKDANMRHAALKLRTLLDRLVNGMSHDVIVSTVDDGFLLSTLIWGEGSSATRLCSRVCLQHQGQTTFTTPGVTYTTRDNGSIQTTRSTVLVRSLSLPIVRSLGRRPHGRLPDVDRRRWQ